MLFVLLKYGMESYSNQDMWYGRSTDMQTNETNDKPEINIEIYSQLIINKATKAIQWGKAVFSTTGAQTTRHPCTKR